MENDFGGSIEANAPGTGADPSAGAVGAASNNGVGDFGAGGGPSGSDAGAATGGGVASVDVSVLGISNQMSFTSFDAYALVGAASAIAVAASSGNAVAATGTLMGALAGDMAAGDPVGVAMSHAMHDIAVGAMAAAQQQASAITGTPVSVLGLWGTAVSFNTATGALAVSGGNGDYIQFAMNGGMSLSVIAPPSLPYYANPDGGQGPG